jgi:hypothetical protein
VSDHPAAIITQSATYNSISIFFSGSKIFLEKAGTSYNFVSGIA